MNETAEQIAVHQSPLEEIHRRAGARFVERDGWSVPASYGDVVGEYETVRGGAGLADLSSRGRLLVSGGEAMQFLNGLITNDVKALADNAWMPAAFPNAQGRLLASVRVARVSDGFLIDTETATRGAVFKMLERFTFAGDFKVKDLSEETALLSVQGARAAEIIVALAGDAAASIERNHLAALKWREHELIVLSATYTGEDGFDLFVNANDAAALWDALVSSGARPIGFEALEILRIEAGQPRYGADMDDTRVVLEAGLDDAVSFTKGCYIGQEIIARIHWRGHVAKKLSGIIFDERVDAYAGDKILSEGKDAGQITSIAFSPRLNRSIALGYVKYAYLAAGTRVEVVSGESRHQAAVAELPFVRGSWYQTDAEVAVK